MLKIASQLNVYLFADDTNVICDSSVFKVFQDDLSNMTVWLQYKKLTLNSDKNNSGRFEKKPKYF